MTAYQTKIDLYLVARTQIRREGGTVFVQTAVKKNGEFVGDRRISICDEAAEPFAKFIERLDKKVVPSFYNGGMSQGYLGAALVVFKTEVVVNGVTVKNGSFGAVFYGENESGEPVVLTVPNALTVSGLLTAAENRSKHTCFEHMQGIEAWTSKTNALHVLNTSVLEQVSKAKVTLGNVDAGDQSKAHDAISFAISAHVNEMIFAINDLATKVQEQIDGKGAKPTLTVNGVPVASAEDAAKKAAEEAEAAAKKAAELAALNDDISDCCTELTDSDDDEDDEDDEDDDQ